MSQHVPEIQDSVSTSVLDGIPVVSVAGEVDECTTDPVIAALACQFDRRPAAVVLDLSAVTFFGSTGLAMLVASHQLAERDGIVFAVVARQRTVLRPMEVTGVDHLVTVHSELPAAVRALVAR